MAISHIFIGKNHWTTPIFHQDKSFFLVKSRCLWVPSILWVNFSVVLSGFSLRWPCRPRPQGAWIAAHLSAIRASRTSQAVLWGTWSQHLGSDWRGKTWKNSQNFLGDSEVFWHIFIYFYGIKLIFRSTLGSWMLETLDDTTPGARKLEVTWRIPLPLIGRNTANHGVLYIYLIFDMQYIFEVFILFFAQIWTFARSLCFLARNGPSFPRTLKKSAKGCCHKLLWNEPWSKFRVVRVARGHTYSTVHPCKAVRTADETCGKPENWDILLCHHGRTLGSAGNFWVTWSL